MLAQKNDAFQETCETVYKLNQNDEVRYLCEMREEGERILRTYQSMLKNKDAALSEKDIALAEKDAALKESAATIAALQAQIKELQKK